MRQLREIPEGIVGQHSNLVVAQIPKNEADVKDGKSRLKDIRKMHACFIYSLVRILRWFSRSGWIVLMSFTSKYSSVVSGGIPRGISVSWDLEHLTTEPAQLHWGGQ